MEKINRWLHDDQSLIAQIKQQVENDDDMNLAFFSFPASD